MLDFNQVRALNFEPIDGLELRKGLSNDVYWLKVESSAITRRGHVLYSCDTQLDYVDAYIPTSRGWREVHTGSNRPFNTRDLDYPCFVFDLSAASQPVAYVRIAADPFLRAAWDIVPKDEFDLQMAPQEKAYSLYFTFLGLFIGLHLIVYLALRDDAYVYYLGYLASVGFLLSTMSGHASMFMWPNTAVGADLAPVVFAVSTLAFLLMLVERLTEIERYSPWLSGYIELLIPTGVSLVVLDLFNETAAVALLGLYLLIVLLWVSCAIVVSTAHRNKPSYLLIGGIALMIPGGIIYYWRAMGWIGPSWLADNILYLTTAADAILLAIALAYRQIVHRSVLRKLAWLETLEPIDIKVPLKRAFQ
ncbi:MAG: hypothetical protein KJP04_08695 [Arenicella sp.]|nr:hypothetical protein [Arenicella sp.]